MADDYDYDLDDVIGFDDDWMYIEDEFALADELAETQIADPGYAGTNYHLEADSIEYDVYHFWDDLEYGYDEYWDYGGEDSKTSADESRHKRKRAPPKGHRRDKRRRAAEKEPLRTSHVCEVVENVLYMSRAERDNRTWYIPPLVRTSKSFALLPDWRERFHGRDKAGATAMPVDMQQAAEAQDEEIVDASGDEADAYEEADAADSANPLADLDPEILKTILRQRMADAGLNDMDDGTFLQALTSMLQGQDNADDATDDLTNALLDQINGAQGEAVSSFLSQLGVAIDSGNDEETIDGETSSVATIPPSDTPPRSTLNSSGGARPTRPHRAQAAGVTEGPASSSRGRGPTSLQDVPPSDARAATNVSRESDASIQPATTTRKRKMNAVEDPGPSNEAAAEPPAKRTSRAKGRRAK